MDMTMFRQKRKRLRMKHRAENGDENAREMLNRSGFNRTPRMPEKPPTFTPGETLMNGHDVQDRGDIPQSPGMYHMRQPQSTKPPEEARLMRFETQPDERRANERPEPKPMKHGKRIFARDPNYNPEPTTPAPNGPGTKQTDMAVGRPTTSLAAYPAGGPGGKGEGSVGPMKTEMHGHTATGPAQSNFSHRNTEYAGEKAPNGPGERQTMMATGKAQKSLAEYAGGGRKRKRKMSRRGMAFVGRSGPGNYTEGSPA